LARFLRLSGQKRVPRPPARITGWNLGGNVINLLFLALERDDPAHMISRN